MSINCKHTKTVQTVDISQPHSFGRVITMSPSTSPRPITTTICSTNTQHDQKVIKVQIPPGAIICHCFTTQGCCPRRGLCPYWHNFDLHFAHLESKNISVTIATTESSSLPVSQKSASSSKVDISSRLAEDVASSMSASTRILADVATPSTSSLVSQKPTSSSEVTATTRSWDPLPSEWDMFGRENLTKEAYAVIIKPHLNDLDNGIVTYKFLHQRLPCPSTSSPVPTTFHPFPECPYDIRLQIWKYALDEHSNTIRVGFRYDIQELGSSKVGISKVRVSNGRLVQLNGPPPLLLVCKELTRIAYLSKMYSAWFRSNKHDKGMLFNPNTDRLFLNLDNTSEYKFAIKTISYAKRMRIHKLAIPLKHLIQGDADDIAETIAFAFRNLQTLYLFAGDGMKDEMYTRDEPQWQRIKKWHRSIWATVNQRRKYKEGEPKQTSFPAIEKEFIPAHVAHHYRIDEYVLTGSVMRNLEYVF